MSRAHPVRINERRDACNSTSISKPRQYHKLAAPPPPELDPFEFETLVLEPLVFAVLDLALLDEALDDFGLGEIVSVTDFSAW
jgi:hypothetical protein